MAGYVKLYRQMEKWEWYTDVNTTKLFLHCLLKANHKPREWRGILIQAGSFVTSFNSLSKETGLSVKQVRTSLNHLKSTHEVAHDGANQFSVITIVKWADYQGSDEEDGKVMGAFMDNQRASEGQAKGKRWATNNNDKNDNNEKNKIKDPINESREFGTIKLTPEQEAGWLRARPKGNQNE